MSERPNQRKLSAGERWVGVRRQLIRALRLALAVALVAGSAFGARALYGWVRQTPRLHIHEVAVLGAEHADAEEIELLAGPVVGVHTFDVDTRALAARVVRHPWVAWAEVRRALPDGLTIEVLERRPAAILVAGDLYFVDGAGLPFKKVAPGEPMDLPVLTGFEDPSSPLRTDGLMGRQAVGAALKLIGALDRAGYPADTLSEIHLDADRGYSVFFTDGGAEVVLGWERFDVKLARLGKLEHTQGLTLTRVARVDLDLERAAVVTALDGATGGGR